jgi:8-oxo-dGTP pyrophosphatase MutT (NUDIX family)
MTPTLFKQKIQIVIFAEGQLLLLQFASLYNGGYQNITGSVEANETFHEAAARELMEEVGLAANLKDPNLKFNFSDRWGYQVEEMVFYCEFSKIPSIKLSEEHQSYKWVPVEKISLSDFVFPTNFEAFKKAMEFRK